MTGINGPKLNVPPGHLEGGPGRGHNRGPDGLGHGPQNVPPPPAPVANPAEGTLPNDGYGVQQEATTPLLTGQGATVERPVTELVPDLRRVRDLPDVRDRFTSDYSLIRNQLTELPELSDTDRAQRSYQFFSAYAQRFVVLANTGAQHGKQGRNDGGEQNTGFVPPGQTDRAHRELADPTDPASQNAPSDGQEILPDGQTQRTLNDGVAAKGEVPQDGEDPNGSEQDPLGQQLTRGGKGDGSVGRRGDVADPDAPESPDAKDARDANKRVLSRLEMLEAEFQEQDQNPDGTPKGTRSSREAAAREAASSLWGETAEKDPDAELLRSPLKTYTQAEVNEELNHFAQSLKDLAFDQLHDPRTGKDGLQAALELLQAPTPEDVERQAQDTALVPRNGDWPPRPPPDEEQQHRQPDKDQRQVPEQLLQRENKPIPMRDLGQSPTHPLDARGASERAAVESLAIRTGGQQLDASRVMLSGTQARDRGPAEGDSPFKKVLTGKRLGSNMLWNTLHLFRGSASPENSALEKDKTDILTYAAIGLLVLVIGVVIMLVML